LCLWAAGQHCKSDVIRSLISKYVELEGLEGKHQMAGECRVNNRHTRHICFLPVLDGIGKIHAHEIDADLKCEHRLVATLALPTIAARPCE
jgi:hypothetical protein